MGTTFCSDRRRQGIDMNHINGKTLLLILVAVASAVAFWYFRPHDETVREPKQERLEGETQRVRKGSGRKKARRADIDPAKAAERERITSREVRGTDEGGLRKEIEAVLKELEAWANTPERKKVRRMWELLDIGDKREAIRLARDLMDSPDASIRREVAGCLGWIGEPAMDELTELLWDKDTDVVEDALSQWLQNFELLTDVEEKIALIKSAVGTMEKQEHVDTILMELAGIDEKLALEALSEIIEEHDGKMVGESAREMFEHLTGGEVYESPSSVEEYINHREAVKEQNAALTVMLREAIEVGDTELAKELYRQLYIGDPAELIEAERQVQAEAAMQAEQQL